MNNKNRVLLFRDDRYARKIGNVYIYVTENNSSISESNTNTIKLFTMELDNDDEAFDLITFYSKRLYTLGSVKTLNNVTDILFNKNLTTLSELTDIIMEKRFTTFPDVFDNEYVLLIKNNAAEIEKDEDEYIISTKNINAILKPELIINEQYYEKGCIKHNILFVKQLPKGLTLLKDTNPERSFVNNLE